MAERKTNERLKPRFSSFFWFILPIFSYLKTLRIGKVRRGYRRHGRRRMNDVEAFGLDKILSVELEPEQILIYKYKKRQLVVRIVSLFPLFSLSFSLSFVYWKPWRTVTKAISSSTDRADKSPSSLCFSLFSLFCLFCLFCLNVEIQRVFLVHIFSNSQRRVATTTTKG